MSDLLDAVLDAHGGLTRWLGVRTLTAKLDVGGPFWGQQGFPDAFPDETLTIDARRGTGPKRVASSISAAVATPSLTSHSASRHNASIRRSATNPSISLERSRGCIPMLRYTSAARCFASCELCEPPHTSTSGIR